MTLEEAIEKLDPDNDEHWTQQGLPKLEPLVEMLGKPVTRKEVEQVAPDANRDEARELKELMGDMAEEEPEVQVQAEKPEEPVKPEEPMHPAHSDGVVPEPMSEEEKQQLINDQVKALQEAIDKWSEFVSDTNKVMEKAKQDILDAEAHLQGLQEEYNKLQPKTTNQQEIAMYLASANRQRTERGRIKQEIFKGINPADFDPRAPIDQAFARKNKRGAQRPIFNQQKA